MFQIIAALFIHARPFYGPPVIIPKGMEESVHDKITEVVFVAGQRPGDIYFAHLTEVE
jgi:hypothetical protein